MKWMTTCRQTSELASRALDERLPFAERFAMRLHLAMCKNCARFSQQIHQMRQQFRSETAANDDTPGLDPEARQRIETELQKKLGS
jgi:hypothetical protein